MPGVSPTVLLGWELGGGLGHVQKLLRLAHALAGAGLRPVLAVRDLIEPGALLRASPFPVVQAPLYSPTAKGAPPTFGARSYADVLALSGFAHADELFSLARGWLALLDLVRPALVVADHAPTLCLAASGVVPTVLIGTGFALPPPDLPAFPPLVPERSAAVPEEQLLAAVREAQRRLGRPPAPTLPGLFQAEGRFVTALPELDPYEDVRREPVWGPLEPLGPPLPPADRPGFFAYLAADLPNCEAILTCLARTGCPGRAYVRGATPALCDRLRTAELDASDRPFPLGEALAQSAVIVSQASASVAQAALAAGRPQLLFPAHLEQFLSARRLHALGVAHYLIGQFPATDVGEGLRQLLAQPHFARRAGEVAAAVQARGPWAPLGAIVAHCQQLVAGSPP